MTGSTLTDRTQHGKAASIALWGLMLTAFASPAAAAAPLPAPGTYGVDAASSVTFNVKNFAVTSVDGKFTTFSGQVVMGDSLASSSVEASIDVASLDTDSKKRDEHLRSSDFFDVARFPKMTWKSTQIWGSPDNFGMKGPLTIHGVTKEVVFSCRITDPTSIRAETTIDRRDFGITSGATVANDVRLRLKIRLR
jgi:polyisoprenoid-binding protein YceI